MSVSRAKDGSGRADSTSYDFAFRIRRKSGTCKDVPAPEPALEGPLADTHCHLGSLSRCDMSFARAGYHGVDFVCDITDVVQDAAPSLAAVEGWRLSARAWLDVLAPKRPVEVPRVRVACGCHPHNAKEYDGEAERRLLGFLRDPRVSCLGEVGLDYFYDLSPRGVQQDVFRRQIGLAHETGLVLALHVRDAHEDALRILDEEGLPAAGTILHCCSLPPDEIRPWIDRGCFIAYGGAVTFAKLDEAREGAKLVPEGRLLTETDAPYMAPVPLRGVENGPEFTMFTAAKLADVRGIRPGDERRAFLAQLHKNAVSLLDREPTPWQRVER